MFFIAECVSNFDFGKFNNILTIESIKGEIDFYFIYGNSLKEVVSNYTALTGRYPLPQRWSLGSHQSRWGYACKEHIDEVVKGYEENDIPCQCLKVSQSGSQSFRVLYYHTRISVEFFHVLTDASGGLEFLKSLVSKIKFANYQ